MRTKYLGILTDSILLSYIIMIAVTYVGL